MLTQLLINMFVAGAQISLMALSFGLIFACARFFHFAQGAVFASGPYLTFLLTQWLGLPFVMAIPLAICLGAVLGCSLELLIYRPIRARKASALVLLLASLGAYIVLQNIFSIVFGDQSRVLWSPSNHEGLHLFGGRITPVQVITVGHCRRSNSLLRGCFYHRRGLGMTIRAVASDPVLASVSGVRINRVFSWVFALGSGLASGAGILVALDTNFAPTMGIRPLLMAVIVVVIGGIGSLRGVAICSLLLAAAQTGAAWFIRSEWQDAISFAILLVFLVFRPHGIFGNPHRKDNPQG